ncbi:hypothetical protein BT96DRAFT_400131 [Gymnopus androsaceus JB14]|uniref:Uncharacterized protein n=1 Tax=Gymnopus androsaceus JB14 TaxID=1447944 RepID=A0A6A4GUG9_9AGAR|nr:hypothetical protein BT96DRAFT_400131 [Gymnopus androsaceus JB14]
MLLVGAGESGQQFAFVLPLPNRLLNDLLIATPLRDYFPDYKRGNNFDSVCGYFLRRFASLNQSATTKKIYAHYICDRHSTN